MPPFTPEQEARLREIVREEINQRVFRVAGLQYGHVVRHPSEPFGPGSDRVVVEFADEQASTNKLMDDFGLVSDRQVADE